MLRDRLGDSVMPFADFSNYRFVFNKLDVNSKISDDQIKYYNKWMKKYSQIFKNEDKSLIAIEWDLRCRKALREFFSSATFFIEAKKI